MQLRSPNAKKEYFTERSRKVLSLAQSYAVALRNPLIEPHHVLLAILRDEGSVGCAIIQRLGLAYALLLEAVRNHDAIEVTLPPKMDLSGLMKQGLEYAVDEVRTMGVRSIDTEHLTIAILRCKDEVVSQLLHAKGLTDETVITQARAAMRERLQLDSSDMALDQKSIEQDHWWYRLTARLMRLIGVEPLPPRNSALASAISSPEGQAAEITPEITAEIHQLTIDIVEGLLQDFPDEEQLYRDRGLSYESMHNYPAAVADYSEIIRLQPEDRNGYVRRAVSYAHNGNYEAAIADCNEAILLSNAKERAEMYYLRAYIHYGEMEYDRALEDSKLSFKHGSESPYTYWLRGSSYMEQGKFEAALEDFKFMRFFAEKQHNADAADLHTYYARALARLAYRQGNYDDAISNARQVLEAEPTDYSALNSLAAALAAQGKQAEAADAYRRSLEAAPQTRMKRDLYYVEIARDYVRQWGDHDGEQSVSSTSD